MEYHHIGPVVPNPGPQGTLCPACLRCFPAPTHLIQMNGSLSSSAEACLWPFIWIRCVGGGTHLKQAGHDALRAWVGSHWFGEPKPTLALRPGLPFPFLMEGFLMLLTRGSLFSGTVTWVSTFTRLPLFLDRSSGWIRGRTPPFDMVTPRRSWQATNTIRSHIWLYYLLTSSFEKRLYFESERMDCCALIAKVASQPIKMLNILWAWCECKVYIRLTAQQKHLMPSETLHGPHTPYGVYWNNGFPLVIILSCCISITGYCCIKVISDGHIFSHYWI